MKSPAIQFSVIFIQYIAALISSDTDTSQLELDRKRRTRPNTEIEKVEKRIHLL